MHIKEKKIFQSHKCFSNVLTRILRFFVIALIFLINILTLNTNCLPCRISHILLGGIYRCINRYKKVEIESSMIHICEVSDGMNMEDTFSISINATCIKTILPRVRGESLAIKNVNKLYSLYRCCCTRHAIPTAFNRN